MLFPPPLKDPEDPTAGAGVGAVAVGSSVGTASAAGGTSAISLGTLSGLSLSFVMLLSLGGSERRPSEEEIKGTDEGDVPNIKYPGNDPTKKPGPDWEWRGQGDPTSGKGSWYNPKTKESLHPDLNHPQPIGPHWDYKSPDGKSYRIYPDGRIEGK